MMNIHIILIILIVILVLFFIINMLLKENIENYGVYCGRYNLKPLTAQVNCKKDSNCAWQSYTTQKGKTDGWCDNAPSNYKPAGSNILNLFNDVGNIVKNAVDIDEEALKSVM